MNYTFILIFLLLFNACSVSEYYTIKNGVVHNLEQKNYNNPSDTLLTVNKKVKNQKINFEEYSLAGKTVLVRHYRHNKDSSFNVSESKGFLKKENGYAYKFYSNNKLKGITTMNNGKVHGEMKTFYENGAKQCECFYQNGLRHGLQKFHWDNGNIYQTIIYDMGKTLNIVNTFNKKGESIEGGSLKNGNGTLNIYDENERVTEIQYFENGKLIKKETLKY